MIHGICDKCGAYMAITGDPAFVLCQCGNIMYDRQLKLDLSVRYIGDYFGSDEHIDTMAREIAKQRDIRDRLARFLEYTLDTMDDDAVAQGVKAKMRMRAHNALGAYKRMLEEE